MCTQITIHGYQTKHPLTLIRGCTRFKYLRSVIKVFVTSRVRFLVLDLLQPPDIIDNKSLGIQWSSWTCGRSLSSLAPCALTLMSSLQGIKDAYRIIWVSGYLRVGRLASSAWREIQPSTQWVNWGSLSYTSIAKNYKSLTYSLTFPWLSWEIFHFRSRTSAAKLSVVVHF